jgi:GNAT superfamily N-acetyltransferase
MFLLDPKADWPAHYFDAVSGDGLKGQRIADLRSQISQGFLVSFFRSPDDLASLASAAIYRREMDRQMKLESLDIDLGLNQPFTRLGPMTDSTLHEIRSRIATPEDIQALQINLGVGMDWWSTRLYFIASLAADLTDIHVIVFVDASDCFVGMATPSVVKERLAQAYAPLRQYERAIGSRRAADIQGEVDRRAGIWETTMGKKGGEEAAKVFVTKQELRRWLGSYLIEQAIEWQSDDSSAWQMQRLVDWPMRFVPITEDGKFIRVVDRQALTDQVARLFIKEQVSRSRSMFR